MMLLIFLTLSGIACLALGGGRARTSRWSQRN